MRQKHNRITRFPKVIYSNGNPGVEFDSSLSVDQGGYLFALKKMVLADNSITDSVTCSTSSANANFRCGFYRCSSEKIDVTPYKKLRLLGKYMVSGGNTYGDYHFRRIYIALLTKLSIYTPASGWYLTESSTGDEDTAAPTAQKSCSIGTSGEVNLTLDISELSGEYYIAAMMILKACSCTAALDIRAIWLE